MLGRSLYADQLAHYFKVFEPLVAAGKGYAPPSRGNAAGHGDGDASAGAGGDGGSVGSSSSSSSRPHPYLHIVCTEHLKSKPAETMSNAAAFLGLPPFDFTPVVSKGMYNVHGAEGYEKVSKDPAPAEEIPAEARNFLKEFFAPHNARLFHMIGSTCPWGA